MKKNLQINNISLNDYLNVAAICYKAAYKKKTKRLSHLELYKKWTDGRHGGMLDIKNPDSKDEFADWHASGRWAGSHPFEIVFSWHRHGIHLYPPDRWKQQYLLTVTNYAYADDFVKMVKSLIKNEIAFQAANLDDVLDFLTGKKYFTVNSYNDLNLNYIPSKEHKKLYFRYIEWEEPNVVRFK